MTKKTYTLVKHKNGVHIIETDDIVHIFGRGSKTTIQTINSQLIANMLPKEWEADLPSEQFYRINRQAIINLDYLITFQKVGKPFVIMSDETYFKVSRRRLSGLKNRLK